MTVPPRVEALGVGGVCGVGGNWQVEDVMTYLYYYYYCCC